MSLFVLCSDGGATGGISKKRPLPNLHQFERERHYLHYLRKDLIEAYIFYFFAFLIFIVFYIFLEYYFIFKAVFFLSSVCRFVPSWIYQLKASPPLDEHKGRQERVLLVCFHNDKSSFQFVEKSSLLFTYFSYFK